MHEEKLNDYGSICWGLSKKVAMTLVTSGFDISPRRFEKSRRGARPAFVVPFFMLYLCSIACTHTAHTTVSLLALSIHHQHYCFECDDIMTNPCTMDAKLDSTQPPTKDMQTTDDDFQRRRPTFPSLHIVDRLNAQQLHHCNDPCSCMVSNYPNARKSVGRSLGTMAPCMDRKLGACWLLIVVRCNCNSSSILLIQPKPERTWENT